MQQAFLPTKHKNPPNPRNSPYKDHNIISLFLLYHEIKRDLPRFSCVIKNFEELKSRISAF